MSNFQRTIKYCAIALAIVLAIGIISAIVNIVFGIVGLSSGRGFSGNLFDFNFHNRAKNMKTIDFSDTFSEVKSLNIDNVAGDLEIKVGETFKVEAQNVYEDFEAKVEGDGELTIRDDESDFSIFGFHIRGVNNPNSKITVYLPEDFVAEEAMIGTGAGTVTIDKLNAEYLNISAGAGNIKGSKLTADQVELDGGVGKITLEEIDFNDADFNCGVGSLDIQGTLTGDSKCECGVGEVRMELNGDVNDYDFDVDSGVGSVRVNGSKIDDDYEGNNSAPNSIEIEGGVGSVKIDFAQ